MSYRAGQAETCRAKQTNIVESRHSYADKKLGRHIYHFVPFCFHCK